MDRETAAVDRPEFPLTTFVVALMKMEPAQRMKASAERAATRYGIRQDWAQWWIDEARRTNEVWPLTGRRK